MRLILVLVLAIMPLAGCQPADSPSGSIPSAQTVSQQAPATLAGEYRVAAIDGQEVSGGIGIALTVTDTMIWFDPRCAGFSWTYTYADGVLTTDRPEKPRSGDGPMPARRMRPTCRIAVHPEQRRLANAIDAVTAVSATASNGLELSGDGHSVTLFSQ